MLLLFFVLRLEPDSGGGQIIEGVGVGHEQPINLKHNETYIRPALLLEDGGEMAADAQSQMVNAVPTTDGEVIPILGAYQSSPNNLTHIRDHYCGAMQPSK